MKLLDICVIGLVSIVFLGRFPSPLNSLKCDLLSKNRLTALSAVCDLLALLVVCDYIASRFSPVGQKHPGWIAAEIVCLVALGLILGPAFRAFLLRFFAKNSSRTQPVKAALVTPIEIRLTNMKTHKDSQSDPSPQNGISKINVQGYDRAGNREHHQRQGSAAPAPRCKSAASFTPMPGANRL
jgi:hypothetical protein